MNRPTIIEDVLNEGYTDCSYEDLIRVIDYILELEDKLSKRPNWPSEMHRQYLAVLDERDILQEEIEVLLKRIEKIESRTYYLERTLLLDSKK